MGAMPLETVITRKLIKKSKMIKTATKFFRVPLYDFNIYLRFKYSIEEPLKECRKKCNIL